MSESYTGEKGQHTDARTKDEDIITTGKRKYLKYSGDTFSRIKVK